MKNKIANYIIIILVIAIVIVLFMLQKSEPFTFTSNMGSMDLKVDNYKRIEYNISNNEITINWKSNDENIATVDANGIVYGKNIGTTTVTGEAKRNNQVESITCIVNVVSKNYDVSLRNITIPDGEILMSKNSSFTIPITYTPNNAYIEKIDYQIDNDNITVNNGLIKAMKVGTSTITITVNNAITKTIKVNVTDNNISPQFIKPIKNILFENDEIDININETKKIKYLIEPNNAYEFSASWNSSNSNIVSINNDGTIKGENIGNATITLTLNNNIQKTVKVNVKQGITNITLNYIPKKIIKIGETLTLHPTVLPSNISNNNLLYESSNNNILSVDSNGIITAKSNGNAIVTISDSTKTIFKTISFTVVPKQGVLYTNNIIWDFSKDEDVIPTRADDNFFSNLARNGKGTLSNGIYVYQKYSYNINNSVLTIDNNRRILMRIYYPQNKDLSTLNTFTFIGGVGEENFYNYFAKIEKNREIIKSSGIIILIANGSNIPLKAEKVVEATNFVKSIINQNQYARNTIGGYSNGGPIAGLAASQSNYDKIMLINTSFYGIDKKTNLSNTEIVVYSAKEDSWIGTDSMINDFIKYNFNNVTVISNNDNFTTKYKNTYLVINPNNSMKKGHTSENLTLSHFFSYGCD